jgi:GT2 family glycosyltransferase
MKVSVVIVTYNGDQWIEKVIKSLYSSELEVEIIIIDNNSSDKTVSLIKKYNEIDLIELKTNLGFGGANNIGLKKAYEAKVDYVFLLNQDAWINSNTISDLVTAHKKNSEFGVLSPMHLNGKGDALDYKFSRYIVPNKCKNLYSDIFLKKAFEKVYEVEFVNAAAWLISSECLEIVGGFNPSFFHYGEDDNYLHRVKFHKLKIGVLPDTTIYHDREYRISNDYFVNPELYFKRQLILNYSNPLLDNSFKKEYKKCYKELIKAFFFMRLTKVKECASEIRILNRLDKKQIIKNKILSENASNSFLK